MRAWGDRELADLGSSVTEWIVLRNIAVAPEPGASQAEIARFSDMGGPALVRHIDRLEADGLVTRTRDSCRPPHDPPPADAPGTPISTRSAP